MCTKVVLVVAPSGLSKNHQIAYIRDVKAKILHAETGKKLHFIFGKSDIRLARRSVIVKVVFDLKDSRNESKIILGIKKIATKRNKGYIPLYLRISNGYKTITGCKNVSSFEQSIQKATAA